MIRIGIIGYGNIGRGIELAVQQNPDMSLTGIFTRRDPKKLILQNMRDIKGFRLDQAIVKMWEDKERACFMQRPKIFKVSKIKNWKNSIDVAILCGGSATDLPAQGPKYASMFNTVDSYDTQLGTPTPLVNSRASLEIKVI